MHGLWLEQEARVSPLKAVGAEPALSGQAPTARARKAVFGGASAPNTGWFMDFMSVRLTNGRQLRTLNLFDEFNREALAIDVDTSMPSVRVIRVLEQVRS